MNDLKSLEELFTRAIFRIPDYQRGYAWRRKQLDEFWVDIQNMLPDQKHYTGMIALEELSEKEIKNGNWKNEEWLIERSYRPYHVVDGQQRLTTFVILLHEIVDLMRKESPELNDEQIILNKTTLKQIAEHYLAEVDPDPGAQGVVKTYKFGYEVDNPSYEYFKHEILMEPNGGDIEETLYTLNLKRAKEFFHDRLAEEYDKNGKKAIEDIFKKVTQKMLFNMYYLADDREAFVSFETMNNRGKKLSNLELLKNRLIYLSTIFNAKDSAKKAVRDKINDTWKSIYGFLGRDSGEVLNDDEFLRDHWIIYFGYSQKDSKNKLIPYDKFLLRDFFNQSRISDKNLWMSTDEDDEVENAELVEEYEEDDETAEKQDGVDIKKERLELTTINEYVDSLKEMIKPWYDVQNPDPKYMSMELYNVLMQIKRLGRAYFSPLMTVILTLDIPDAEKIECLKKIERFIFLQFRLNKNRGTYKSVFFWARAHRLYKNRVSVRQIIKDLDEIGFLDADKVMHADNIINNFNSDGFYSWGAKKYFLYEYEVKLRNENKRGLRIVPEEFFGNDNKQKVWIEHIYPQTDTDPYWQERFGKYSEQERKKMKNSLGNMMALSAEINIKLQNYSFDEKKNGVGRERGYKLGSYQEMEVAKNRQWTPEKIKERGLKLLEFMEERYDFKFPNRKSKIKMLGLEFLSGADKK